MDEQAIAFLGVAGQAGLTRSGELSSVELTTTLLKRIDRLNPWLNAFRIVMRDEALEEAAARDAIPHEERGPLHGLPIAIKDEIDVAGQLTTFGTAARTVVAERDAELVRLLRAAGAVIVGKTLMPEFGAFPFTESTAFGITRNPWDLTRTPGGSSGGSAAAVAAGLTAAAIGGDSGGSIRIPSACCGLFGLKPTRGYVSTAPQETIWHALGTVGPLTRTVTDAAIVYDVLRADRTLPDLTPADGAQVAGGAISPLKIAVSGKPSQLGIRLNSEQAVALHATADTLRGLGHEVVEEDPDVPDLTPAFIPQVYGGIRDEAGLVEQPQLLERRTRQGLTIARAFPGPVVSLAVRHGQRIATRVNRLFDRYDALLTPTIAPLPRQIGVLDGISNIHAGLRSLPYIAYTAVWNVCGNPAASIPAGSSADGLPLAVQLIARPHGEPTIISLAAQLEGARPWADRHPPEPYG